MKIKILVLIAIFSQSCLIKGPIVVNTYTDQSYTNLSNFTYTMVKDENSNPEIWINIENSLNRKGYFQDDKNFDLAVFYKVYNEKTKLTDVDFVSSGNVLSKKYTTGKSLIVQIMDAKTKEVFYRGTCSRLPNTLSKSQLKSIVGQAFRNLDEVSNSQFSFRK
ncbi:MAG: DUF4136 domain-containing protein [Leadbetterella sp.]|nr:DUF4136 domain-containing protein [Leadbetterella sp.]